MGVQEIGAKRPTIGPFIIQAMMTIHLPGHCRRLIGRALNLSRVGGMTQAEMDKAFARAADGEDTVVGVCSHDWRDLARSREPLLRSSASKR